MYALDNIGKGGGRNGGSGGSSGKGTKEKPLKSAGAMHAFNSILSAIESGKDDVALNMIESIRGNIEKDPIKFYDGWLDDEVRMSVYLFNAFDDYFSDEKEYDNAEQANKAKEEARNQLFGKVITMGSDTFSAKDYVDAKKYNSHVAKDRADPGSRYNSK